jgi:ATP-dependent Clp protease ATP-binding subunit ClpX
MVKTLAKVVGLPYALGDATSLTEAGYVGDDVETLLSTLLKNTPNKGSKNEPDIEIAERGIIFIDEIDKISKTGQSQSVTRDVSGEGVQQALLKMVEGSVVRVQPVGSRKHPESDCISVDTSQILFIAAGSFVGLDQIIDRRLGNCSMGFSRAEKKTESLSIMPDDLIEFGMIPEFVGRFHNVEKLEKLTKEQLKATI